MSIHQLRADYHRKVCDRIVRYNESAGHRWLNLADSSNRLSKTIAEAMIRRVAYPIGGEYISGQTAGHLFESETRDFIQRSFSLLQHLRPGDWEYSLGSAISSFSQYAHLAEIEELLGREPELATSLGGDYIVKPDIVVSRRPLSDAEINRYTVLVDSTSLAASLSPLRSEVSHGRSILHASISCKWTLRSDRSQNARTEALNLVRNRKGHLPHVVCVTAEPTPNRIASLALGTGDLDCVYHFALHELRAALLDLGDDGQLELLDTMIIGNRLRDISDLPIDLAS